MGNCLNIMPTLGTDYRLVFADPPFNIGQEYQGYVDRVSQDTFAQFTADWINVARHRIHKDTGVLCLHGPDELCELYLRIMSPLSMKREAWIIWNYGFGQYNEHNWTDAKCHLLVYSWGTTLWDPPRVPSVRMKMGDTRACGLRVPSNVWGTLQDGPYWGRVQGNNEERWPGHPNQLPERYLERIIRTYTIPGDKILDPFGGSGTTIVVAEALGRICDTIDISEWNVESIERRRKVGSIRVKDSLKR